MLFVFFQPSFCLPVLSAIAIVWLGLHSLHLLVNNMCVAVIGLSPPKRRGQKKDGDLWGKKRGIIIIIIIIIKKKTRVFATRHIMQGSI